MKASKPWVGVVVGLLVLSGAAPAHAHRDGSPRRGHARCRNVWDGHRTIIKRRQATIRCWARVRGLDPDRVIRIARCESGRDLQDRWDPYWGTFQHPRVYWPGRARALGARGHRITGVWAQAKVSTAMMKATGYGQHWPHCGRYA